MYALVRPSINAGVEYGQNLVEEIIRSLSNGLGLTCTVINGLDLLYHDKPCHLWVPGDGYMERIATISVGQGANYDEAGLFVE
jgi:hypothetical protein